jgi:uncharacterized protein (DUF2147 family)
MKYILFFVVLFYSFSAFSQVSSIVGSWKTIDDETGEAKSIVRIYKGADGKYYGKIEKLFKNPDGKCDKCKDANKDKPLLGLVIITDMIVKGDILEGGSILDPANGKKYSAIISYEKDSGKLKVRGYVGLSVAGRNQFWEKVN